MFAANTKAEMSAVRRLDPSAGIRNSEFVGACELHVKAHEYKKGGNGDQEDKVIEGPHAVMALVAKRDGRVGSGNDGKIERHNRIRLARRTETTR